MFKPIIFLRTVKHRGYCYSYMVKTNIFKIFYKQTKQQHASLFHSTFNQIFIE